jgi:hypothetical protein
MVVSKFHKITADLYLLKHIKAITFKYFDANLIQIIQQKTTRHMKSY